MSNALSGLSSLSYQGTNASNPPNILYSQNDPTTYASQNVSLGDLWLNTANQTAWLLVALSKNLATWVQLGVTSNILKLSGNTGGTVSPNGLGVISVVGDGTTITVAGNPGTHTLTASLVAGGVFDTITGDTGGPISPNGSGTIFIEGTPGVVSVTGNPGTNTLTINATSSFATSYVTDAGTATPAANTVTIVGGPNINTSGSGSTVTINLDTTLTGLTSLNVQNLTVTGSETFSNLGQGVVQSSPTGVISSSKGTNGQILIGSTSGAPTWSNLTAGSNITITNAANTITIAATAAGGSPGMVLLATQDMTGLTSYTFTGYISTTYLTYLLVAENIQITTSSVAKATIGYLPYVPLSTYNNYVGGINYSTYNSTVNTNYSVGGGGNSYPIAPIFGSGVPQFISLYTYMYNLPSTYSGIEYGILASGQFTVATGGTLYQGVSSAYVTSTSGTLPGVTSILFNMGGNTIVSGTLSLYGLSK